MRVKKYLSLHTMAYISKNLIGSRIASFFSMQEKKAAEEAATYAKLEGSSAETVDAADPAHEVLGALIFAPSSSAAGQVEVALVYGMSVAYLTREAPASGAPTNDQAREELSSGVPSLGQATVALPSDALIINQAVVMSASGSSSVGQMATVLPEW